MRVLCVLNGPFLGTREGRERRVNRHTARFLIELSERLGDVVVASSLVDLGESGNLSDFDLALRNFSAGDEVEVTVLRDGQRVKLKVTLAKPR